NLIMDPQTLKVKALIDFEYAGFYLLGIENWLETLCLDVYNKRSNSIAYLIKQFLAIEYEDCYAKWNDKKRLDEFIKLGKLPSLDQMRQDSTEN
ncbi:hypothetical protein P154DRAFT_451394, partial [Amniculicola lignicola CBS 123094]